MAEKYIGIDINDKFAMVSQYTHGMSEPGTFSMVTGSEIYQIPVCIAKSQENGSFIYGEEARAYARQTGASCIEGLLKKALSGETAELGGQVYEVMELLFLFVEMLTGLLLQDGEGQRLDRLTIAVENMNLEYRRLFKQFAAWLKLPPSRLILIDYRESFYYYAYSQPLELCAHDTALFYYTSKKLLLWQLSRDRRAVPQIIDIREGRYRAILENRDEEFMEIIKQAFSGRLVSAVYLIGDGFDGGWMKKSLSAICTGRRAFMGKNLFSKGACYAAAAKAGKEEWPYIYMGDDEIKVSISLKVNNKDRQEMLPLITAGDNWYEAFGECEVILDGSPSIDFWIQAPKCKNAVVKSLELAGMPERESRLTRLRITLKPEAVDKILICIRDMGFGGFVKSSEKVWEHVLSI